MADWKRILGKIGMAAVTALLASPSSKKSKSRSGSGGPGASERKSSGGTATLRSGGLTFETDREASPGQFGDSATTEVPFNELADADVSYAPHPDGDPDPGEVVWTWVPFEELDGRGKDRPLLVLARESHGSVLGVYLTSKAHAGDGEYVEIGPGGWDGKGRSSWVNLSRLFRVWPGGMRREGASASRAQYDLVVGRIRR